jgi:hypothetical protein
VDSEEKLFKKLKRIPWSEMNDKYYEFYFKEYSNSDLENYMKKEETFFNEYGWTIDEFIREHHHLSK